MRLALGEIAIAARDGAAMRAFYGETLGLPLLSERPGGIAFYRLHGGHEGHVPVLALFPSDGSGGPVDAPAPAPAPARSRPPGLHHVALSLSVADQEAMERRLAEAGVETHYQAFPWIGWRGLFMRDPDGNTVELVAKVGEGEEA